jgi:hypothetical protein
MIVLVMALLARAAGSGWKINAFASAAFGLPFAAAVYHATGYPLLAIAAWGWAWVMFNTGHGNAYHMGFEEHSYADRPQTLDKLVRPVTNQLGLKPRSAGYCWAFMGLKGLLIGLPLLPFGVLLAVTWPLSYYLSFRFTKSSELAECLSGASAGAVICLLLI